jgi:hypothetical protein
MFANVGLAYRQRAQLLPFLLIVAAVGYERRRLKKKAEQRMVARPQWTPLVPDEVRARSLSNT